jgi:hypothetical protein
MVNVAVRNIDRVPLLDILVGHIFPTSLLKIIDQYSWEDETLNVFIFTQGHGYHAKEMSVALNTEFTKEHAFKTINEMIYDNDDLIEETDEGKLFLKDNEKEIKEYNSNKSNRSKKRKLDQMGMGDNNKEEKEKNPEKTLEMVYQKWGQFSRLLPDETLDCKTFELMHVQFAENERIGKVIYSDSIDIQGTD